MLMTCCRRAPLVFVGLEISSISTYILAGFRKGSATASESSIKYFLLGSFATAFFLYGIALAFGATGTTRIDAIAHGLPHTATPRLACSRLAMILIGIGFKVSAAPFQVWTPDVYQGAPVAGRRHSCPPRPRPPPSPSCCASSSPRFPILRSTAGPRSSGSRRLSMIVGNLGALLQRDVKRMLAYSSIAHAGYLLVAFTAFPHRRHRRGLLLHRRLRRHERRRLRRHHPASPATTSASAPSTTTPASPQASPSSPRTLAFFLLSLIGIPFTGGFFGKFYVFSAALHAGNVWLAVIGLLNSGIACFYYLRLLAALYSKPAEGSPVLAVPRMSITLGLAILLSASATLLLGVDPRSSLELAQRGAGTLLQTGHPAQAEVQVSDHTPSQ